MRIRKQLRRKLPHGLLAGLVCAVATAALMLSGALESLEFKTLDHRFRNMPRRKAALGSPADIALVLIDQSSLDLVSSTIRQQWPWPREFYAKIIEFLHRAGAKAIIFDMYFSEPDRDRPDISGADSDAALTAATASAEKVVHSYVLQKTGQPTLLEKRNAVQRASALEDEHALLAAPAMAVYETGALPAAALADAAVAIGFATQEPESDNICRRLRLLARFDGVTVMSQALAAAAFLTPEAPMQLQRGTFRIGTHPFAIDDAASVFLHWYRPPPGRVSPFDHHSAYNILRAAILQEAGMDPDLPDNAPPESVFKDRIVFIGSTAPGLFDNWATPLSKTTAGVEIQATALANLLRGDTVTRGSRRLTLLVIALLAMTTAIMTSLGRRHTLVLIITPLALLALIIAGSYTALLKTNLFLDIVPPVLAVLSTFLASTLANYLTERKHSQRVRNIFEHYLDHAVVENLIADPEKMRLGGERRECTVMFTDVANFTTISESLSPEQVVSFMNIYLDAMTDIIIREGGFVDKFIGDEIVAVFGAPNRLPDHATRACRAVLHMRDTAQTLQPRFREVGCTTDIFARTGICTGDVIIGNMGSENRMNYTAMGNTMNLGARIQGVNKMTGTRILVSSGTAAAAGDREFVFREIDAVRVKGKRQADHIFELLGFNTADHPFAQAVACYRDALEAYRHRRWAEAVALLAPLVQSGDAPAAILADRCRDCQGSPPPDDWDGITSLLSK